MYFEDLLIFIFFRIQEAEESMKFSLPWFCFCAKKVSVVNPYDNSSLISSNSNFQSSKVAASSSSNFVLSLQNLKKSSTEPYQLIKNLNEEMKILRAEIKQSDSVRDKESISAIKDLKEDLKKIKDTHEQVFLRWHETLNNFKAKERKQDHVIKELKTQNYKLKETIKNVRGELQTFINKQTNYFKIQQENIASKATQTYDVPGKSFDQV